MSDLFGDGAGNAPQKRGRMKSAALTPSGATSAGAGTGATRYAKPLLRVRPALRMTNPDVCRALTAMGIQAGRETAPGVLAWEWSDNGY